MIVDASASAGEQAKSQLRRPTANGRMRCSAGVWLMFMAPSPVQDVATIVEKIAKRVVKLLRRRGYLDREGEFIMLPDADDIFKDKLDTRDPLRKAQRAAARKESAESPSPGKEAGSLEAPTRPSLGKEARFLCPAIPAAVRHGVWLRDGG